jgi:hypothetical protein
MAMAGQAMVEFAVAVTVLAVLLMGLPVIHRYHELQLATIEGARRLGFLDSWRRTGSAPGSSASSLADDTATVRRELFPADALAAQPEATGLNARLTISATPGMAGQAQGLLLAPLAPARWLGSGFDLHDDGLRHLALEARVSTPDSAPEPFAGLSFPLTASYVLLGDGWGSAGPGQVASRAGGLLITHLAQSLRGLTTIGTSLLSLVEPAMRDFCPGRIDPEVLPADRLGPRDASAPITGWRPQC